MGLAAHAWNSLYLENHDHPRIISRYGSEAYRIESGKSLACSYLCGQVGRGLRVWTNYIDDKSGCQMG